MVYYKAGAEYNRRYIELYQEEGRRLGIHIRLILVEELEFGIENHQWFLRYQNSRLDKPDFVICRAIYPLLSRQFELMGMKVFNNSTVAEICNDKARTYQYLAKTGIRMVDSCFYRNGQLNQIVDELKPMTVIKAVDGHGGSQVFLRDQWNDKQEMIDKLGSSDIVVQPFTGSRHQDLRVYVIGKEVIAAVIRTAKEGFRANYSLGGEVALYQLSRQERDIVDKIIEVFDFGLVGIDFILGDEGELIFNEIEDVVGARMLYQCSDINLVQRYLSYILDNL